MTSRQLAIACQGGGSHTAFTAGVLKHLLEQKVHHHYRLVGLSGTSGGAICALLAWYGLLNEGQEDDPYGRLTAFWRDNATRLYWERMWNLWLVGILRLREHGMLPDIAASPYNTLLSWLEDAVLTLSPRDEFVDFQALLGKYVHFEELDTFARTAGPRLLLGAVNVLTGAFKAFDSWKGEITVDAVLASAAIPTVFQAVQIGDGAYWDGLFSQNPPLVDFLEEVAVEEKPEEIWIIQINPPRREGVPQSPAEIIDRRNELMGNLSLEHEIKFIATRNQQLNAGVIKEEIQRGEMKPLTLRRILMSEGLRQELDAASKLDRSKDLIERLLADGEQQAQSFLHHMDASTIIG